jgi:hypothetical protein
VTAPASPEIRRLLSSPAWFVPFDDFRRARFTTGLIVELDRWTGADWVPSGLRPTLTPSGVVAYPGLGRRREPWTVQPELYRARFQAPGYRPLYTSDGEPFDAARLGREFLAYPYDDEHPPQIRPEPEAVVFLPDRTFPYPPGTRLVTGVVRHTGSGTPVGNALVESSGETTLDRHPWRERTLTDGNGAFRLALRWSGRTGPDGHGPESFTLTATERPGRTGQVDISLPEDPGATHVIEISE